MSVTLSGTPVLPLFQQATPLWLCHVRCVDTQCLFTSPWALASLAAKTNAACVFPHELCVHFECSFLLDTFPGWNGRPCVC